MTPATWLVAYIFIIAIFGRCKNVLSLPFETEIYGSV
jgi:hypothetical protein